MDPITIALGLAPLVPEIIRWVTGNEKAAEAAETVIGVAKKVTGREDPQEAVDAVMADPALAVQFRMAVMENEAKMDQLYLMDIKDARARDVEYVKAGRTNTRANTMLALTWLGLLGCMLTMIFQDVDANTAIGGALMLLIGKFAGNWETAFHFEFGSSRGSKDKDETARILAGVPRK